MHIFTKRNLLRRISAVVMCCVLSAPLCVQGSFASAAQTDNAPETKVEAAEPSGEPEMGVGSKTPSETELPAETEEAFQTEMPSETDLPSGAVPAVSASPKVTEIPAVPVPETTECPSETELPGTSERPDLHAEDKQYICSNADRALIGEGDELKAVDVVYLTYTMADRSYFDHDPTLNDLWTVDEDGDGTPDNMGAFVGQSASYAVLYAPGIDSDYYAAKIDMASSEDMWVTDWGAANSRNGLGEDCEGVIYDKKTGIVYIPKRYCGIPEQGPEGLGMVRFQLLYAVSGGNIMDAETGVKVNVTGENGASSREVDVPALLPNTTIQLAGGSEVESVQVNAHILEQDCYEYNKRTGELVVFQSPTSMETLDVEMSGTAAARAATIATSAKPMDQAIREAVNNGQSVLRKSSGETAVWEFSTDLSAGNTFVIGGINTYYYENGRGDPSNTAPSIDIFANKNGSRTGKAGAYDTQLGNDIFLNTWNMNPKDSIDGWNGPWYWNGITLTTDRIFGSSSNALTRAANITTESYHVKIENGVHKRDTNSPIVKIGSSDINMMCSHVQTSIIEGGEGRNIGGGVWVDTSAEVLIRVLGTTIINGDRYTMVAMGASTVFSQAGVGIYIMKYEISGGDITIEKRPEGNIKITQSKYTLGGAEYGVYTDQGCTRLFKIAVTQANASNTMATATISKLKPGTYYVRETKASPGFSLDVDVHKVTVTSGNVSKVVSYEPFTGQVDIIKEYSDNNVSDNPNYSLEGAVYSMYSDQACTKKEGQAKTDASGRASFSGVKTGKHYIRETVASMGCNLDTTVHEVTVTAQNAQTIQTVRSVEPITGGKIILQKSYKPVFDILQNVVQGIPGYSVLDAMKLIREYMSNPNYSLEGAVYGRYSDPQCKSLIDTRTTGVDGSDMEQTGGNVIAEAVWGNVELGTYYIKEITPPKGCMLDLNIYKADVIKDGTTADGNSSTVEVHVMSTDDTYTGQILVMKQSANPDATNGNRNYSFRGAVYGLYTNEACTEDSLKDTQKVNEYAFAQFDDVLVGKCWIREITPAPGYDLDETIYEVELSSANTYVTVTSNEPPKLGCIDLLKKSADPEWTDGNPDYELSGAEYGRYSDPDCSDLIDKVTTDKDGRAAWKEVPLGTYYVRELVPPRGYELDPEVYVVEITDENAEDTMSIYTIEVTSVEKPISKQKGQIDLQKKSGSKDMTDGNNLYGLGGAVYGRYSDPACTDLIDTRTTDENGKTAWTDVETGTYYVKEISAPEGYHIDEKTYTVRITEDNAEDTRKTDTIEVTSAEPPVYAPADISVTKTWDGAETATIPTLEGTQFTVKYFAGAFYTEEEVRSMPATRTWVLEVKKETSGDKTEYKALLRDEYLAAESSDPFYFDSGRVPVLPLGTYTIQETKAAAGYTLEGTLQDGNGNTVAQGNLSENVYLTYVKDVDGSVKLTGGNIYTSYDRPVMCRIELNKKDPSGEPLAGVEFEIRNSKGEPVKDTNGQDISRKTTDSSGHVVWENLYPDTYTITEVKTVKRQTLLAEPLVVEAPMRLTEQQAAEQHIDTSRLTWDEKEKVWYVHNFVYDITNHSTIIMPMSGAGITISRFLPLAVGMAAIVFALYLCCPILNGRRRGKMKAD